MKIVRHIQTFCKKHVERYTIPAYLGTTDQLAIDEASKRLLPFTAAKIPYVVNLVGYGRMSDAVLEGLIKMFG